jgi:coenzyme PQQ precursor peptide PqqA
MALPPERGSSVRRLIVTIRPRRHIMKWETPEAIDMRFGMEITMYISNR